MKRKKKSFRKNNLKKASIVCVIAVLMIMSTAINTVGLDKREFEKKLEIIQEEKDENPFSTPQTWNSLSYQFEFEKPKLKETRLYKEEFTKIEIEGCISLGKEIGSPNLPVKFVKLLIPYGKKVSDIQVSGELSDLDTRIFDLTRNPVAPYQQPMPIGEPAPDFIAFNKEEYRSSDFYPSEIIDNKLIGYSHGYAIYSFGISPVKYNPAEGTIVYYPLIDINIELKDNEEINPFYRDNKYDKAWVEKIVDNPEVLDSYPNLGGTSFSYPGGLCDPSDSYDYVIITTTNEDLDDWTIDSNHPYNWTSLMDKHETEDGLSCTLVTVQDIDACADYYNTDPLFNDTQAHVREFCRDAYQDWGTSYVLIGADDDQIPAREMDYDYESNVDADIYWNHLDKTFNDDGDYDWGEEGDSGFDLFAEMYIGRLTCDNPTDVCNWMNKSFYYADSYDKDYLENAAFYGGNTGWSCQGDDFIDYSAIKGTDDWLGPDPHADGPYPTWLGFQYGFETWNLLNIGKEYNMSVKWTAEPPNPGWQGGSESAAINGLKTAINNNDVTLISGIAHANSGMSLDVYDSDWESDYHNTKPFFLHDYGCHCGDIDTDDGVIHSMLFHSDTELAFATVYHTGYGWGNSDGTNSSSALQQKSFWDYMFDTTNNSLTALNWQLGKAMAWSKDTMAPTINWTSTGAPGSWRGTIESCLLFGDPAQRIKPPFQPEHGLAVFDLEVDSYVAHGETVYVEADVVNVGSNDETNIVVDFKVDDSVIDTTTIPNLNIGQMETLSFPWNPDYGTFLVGIRAQPVPGENITTNNEKNKTVHVIPAPDIWINPTDFTFNINTGDTDSDSLTIGNENWAETDLHFNISTAGGSWLSVIPDTGVVGIGSSTVLTVNVDATSLTEGDYHANIIIDSNDLDETVLYIPVDLHVVFGNDVGPLSVVTPTDQQLPGTYPVKADIYNFGSNSNTFVVNCTIFEGGGQQTEDFETSDGGYTHGDGPGVGTIDDWEWGVPTSGPGGAHSGSNVWATNLDGDHSNGADSVLDSAEIDLNMFAPEPELRYWQWYDHTTYDCGNVKISTDGGITWNLIYPDGGYTGTATGGNQGIPYEPAFTDSNHKFWHEVVFDLSAYEGETVKIRWHFGSTTTTTHPGWYIDDVSFKSALTLGPGDTVYTSEESISLPAYTSGIVDFSPQWDAQDLGYYAIQITTLLPTDEDTSNDQIIDVVEISMAPEGHISQLKPGWNFVSLPFNQTIDKSYLIVNYEGTNYNWAEATSPSNGPMVSSYLFGWNRDTQSYIFADTLEPGYGYWVYSYMDIELKAPVFSVNFDGYITTLKSGWNVIGIPNNLPEDKVDIIVESGGTEYTWAEAIDPANGPIIESYLFGWDNIAQSYIFSDTLNPGDALWLYSYEDDVVLKTGGTFIGELREMKPRWSPPPSP